MQTTGHGRQEAGIWHTFTHWQKGTKHQPRKQFLLHRQVRFQAALSVLEPLVRSTSELESELSCCGCVFGGHNLGSWTASRDDAMRKPSRAHLVDTPTACGVSGGEGGGWAYKWHPKALQGYANCPPSRLALTSASDFL